MLSDLSDAFAECEMRGKTPHRILAGRDLFQRLKDSNWLTCRQAEQDGASVELWFYRGVAIQEDKDIAPGGFHMTVL
jgi:hypothetical protein